MLRLAGYLLFFFLLGFAAVACAHHGNTSAQAAAQAVTCYFDGGGQVTAGNAARTSDGHVWLCMEDGQLRRIG